MGGGVMPFGRPDRNAPLIDQKRAQPGGAEVYAEKAHLPPFAYLHRLQAQELTGSLEMLRSACVNIGDSHRAWGGCPAGSQPLAGFGLTPLPLP